MGRFFIGTIKVALHVRDTSQSNKKATIACRCKMNYL